MGSWSLRLHPRSIRGRITLLTVVITTLVLVPMAVITSMTIHRTGWVDTAIGAETVTLITLTGAATWMLVGQALEPVDAIRAQLAEITFNDLSDRIPQPSGDDEVARLARTANQTLGRLEEAVNVRRQTVADATHELHTPLAGLRLQLEEARLHPGETELLELLDRLLGDVDRLQQIVTDVLYLAGVEATGAVGQEQVDLAEFVRRGLKHRRDPLPTQLFLQEGVTVDAVPDQLGRALGNLLDNAQRHADQTVGVEVRAEGDTALLVVFDDGSGIAEPDRDKIFERFIRVDAARSRDRGGSGLGLAIAAVVVRAHGGTIRVQESPTGGATFEVRLPLGGVS